MDVTVMAARRSPLEIAQQHEKKGNLAKAATAYSEYLSVSPKDAKVLLRLAELKERLGETAAAAEAFHRLGMLHLEDGIDSKAIAVLRRALQLGPSHAESVLLLAELLVKAGKRRDAVNALEAAGRATAAAGDHSTRLKMLEAAAKLDDAVGSKLAYAQVLIEVGNKGAARAVLREAADQLREHGTPLDRLQVLEQLLSVSLGDAQVAIEAAMAAVALKDYRRALVSLRIAMEHGPDNADMVSLTGAVLHAMGEQSKALLVARLAARMYGGAGRNAEAKKNWLAVLRLNPGDEEATSAIGTAQPAPKVLVPPAPSPLTGVDAKELDRVLGVLEEKETAQPAADDHELVISLDDLDVDLSIEPDSPADK
ncbi:MAG TPA: tetratricopeptide repeat protein [Myxococcaceae bacterium]|nr:tetratricopeptide repeat protein [Myxococcaceae bacterium]